MKLQLVFLILLIPFSLAACSDGKVDINSASLSSLDKLTGIGPTYAQRIIDARPFSSLDDLLNVNGIGPATLEKIKSQALACISEEAIPESTQQLQSAQTSNTVSVEDLSPSQASTENIINLNSGEVISNKVQKEEVIFESKNEKVKRYLIFAFAFFLILIIIFLLLTR
ncbi:Photosystem II 12 kDa extrinsic protein [uncultured archaeon]|nr:Photosystem II 12 kDa extrinsic protein [uncultured archaeon]